MKGAFFSKLCTEAKSSARALNYKNIYFGRRSSAQFPAATKPPLYPGTGEGSFRFFFAYRAAAPGISGYRPAENYRAARQNLPRSPIIFGLAVNYIIECLSAIIMKAKGAIIERISSPQNWPAIIFGWPPSLRRRENNPPRRSAPANPRSAPRQSPEIKAERFYSPRILKLTLRMVVVPADCSFSILIQTDILFSSLYCK